MSPERVEVEVDGRQLSVSNLTKVFYPKTGLTKAEFINYYARIADAMLPHLVDRPITMKRYPHGVDGQFFFEKHAPAHTPEWIRTAAVPHGFSPRSRAKETEDIIYVVISDRPALVWAANLAAIEFHVPLWRIGDGKDLPKAPDHMVFDLDPGPGTTIVQCCEVAGWIAKRLDGQLIVAKTSGSKGLQLYTPLKSVTSEEASEQAHEIARAMESDHPDAVVSNMKKELRKGKVLVDWSQNHPTKTTVAVYSLRALPEPTVSTPVTWNEIRACAKSGDPDDLRFQAIDVLDRVERLGDSFAPLITQKTTKKR